MRLRMVRLRTILLMITPTPRGDVPDDAGAAVVVLVGHTLTDGRVRNDINEVADLHVDRRVETGGHRATELLGEEVAGAALVTVGVDHDE